MKQLNIRQVPALILGTLLTVPAVYFIFVSLLKYQLHQPFLFDAISPFVEAMGIAQSPRWIIKLLIVFGPVLAFFINLMAIADIHFASGYDRISCHLSIRKSRKNVSILMISGLVLFLLFIYQMGAHCNC